MSDEGFAELGVAFIIFVLFIAVFVYISLGCYNTYCHLFYSVAYAVTLVLFIVAIMVLVGGWFITCDRNNAWMFPAFLIFFLFVLILFAYVSYTASFLPKGEPRSCDEQVRSAMPSQMEC